MISLISFVVLMYFLFPRYCNVCNKWHFNFISTYLGYLNEDYETGKNTYACKHCCKKYNIK